MNAASLRAAQLDFFQAPVPRMTVDCSDEQLDLGSYDRVVIALSGGKDSIAQVCAYLERGGDPKKMEFWHHIVDCQEGSKLFDWPCTNGYCKAVAAFFKAPIYFTWKVGGFEGEMLRENALTQPIRFEAPQPDGSIIIKQTGGKGGKISTRRKFPQVSADCSVRWCSSYLKIDNARTALRNQERFNNSKTLFLCGERAEEALSPQEFLQYRAGTLLASQVKGRAAYPRFQVDDSDARNSSMRRHIDRWRPVHGWSEVEIWAILERWRINPHPCYRLGWGRCSCAACIFNGADEFASLRLINPKQFNALVGHEVDFDRTMKRTIALNALADLGTPFVMKQADIDAAMSEEWYELIELAPGEWELPAGAFSRGGGPS